jgi:glycosyltransferase involved in cell wall biosynthesis
MKNILFIHQSAELYGSDKTLLLLLKHLDKQKFLPVVILPSNGPLKDELEKEKIKVVIAPVLKLHRQIFKPKKFITFLKEIKSGISIIDQLNSQYHFDIIYSNTLAVLLGMFYARKSKIKHIWHVHEIIVHPKIIATIFPRLLNKYADVVVCNSKATMKNLIDRKNQLKNKTVVVYNGIEEPERNPALTLTSKKDFGFSDRDIIITLVGRINRLKGHKWLLSTFIKYLSQNQKIKLLFVGSTFEGQEHFLHEIEQIILGNKLEQKVTIIPFTKDLSKIWAITDIAVMPSTEAESFGLVATEAMLERKPVVGSNHGGLAEIIINNETGFLVKPNNEVELSEVLIKLIDSPEKRNLFGEKGYRRVINEFSMEAHIKKISNLFLN